MALFFPSTSACLKLPIPAAALPRFAVASRRAFRMKVFSSEFEQCGERRDKLIFEHFQTPLSPSNSTALQLHRVFRLRLDHTS